MKLEDAIKTDKFVNERHKAMINIKYTANWMEQYINSKLKPFKISIQQFNVLRILRGSKGPLSINDVRDRMVEKSPNITRLMDKLIEKGYISRFRCDEDRRVVYVEICEEGLNLLTQLEEERVVEAMPSFMENISEEEAAIMNRCLDQLRDSL